MQIIEPSLLQHYPNMEDINQHPWVNTLWKLASMLHNERFSIKKDDKGNIQALLSGATEEDITYFASPIMDTMIPILNVEGNKSSFSVGDRNIPLLITSPKGFESLTAKLEVFFDNIPVIGIKGSWENFEVRAKEAKTKLKAEAKATQAKVKAAAVEEAKRQASEAREERRQADAAKVDAAAEERAKKSAAKMAYDKAFETKVAPYLERIEKYEGIAELADFFDGSKEGVLHRPSEGAYYVGFKSDKDFDMFTAQARPLLEEKGGINFKYGLVTVEHMKLKDAGCMKQIKVSANAASKIQENAQLFADATATAETAIEAQRGKALNPNKAADGSEVADFSDVSAAIDELQTYAELLGVFTSHTEGARQPKAKSGDRGPAK